VASGAPIQAVVVNAGIANAGTGEKGMELCRLTAEHAGKVLGIPANAVLLGSTGVIGPNLPIDRLRFGIDQMAESLASSEEAGVYIIMNNFCIICFSICSWPRNI